MDNETYEETRLKKDDTWAKYMKEGMEVSLLFWNGTVISVDPPTIVELEVLETDPNVKGNTTSGAHGGFLDSLLICTHVVVIGII
jgi:hypothetical protein